MGPDETLTIPGGGEVFLAPAGTELPTGDNLEGWTRLGHAVTGFAESITELGEAAEAAAFPLADLAKATVEFDLTTTFDTPVLDELFNPHVYLDGDWYSRKDLGAAMAELGLTGAELSMVSRRWMRVLRSLFGRLTKRERKAELRKVRRQQQILRLARRHRQRRLIGIKA